MKKSPLALLLMLPLAACLDSVGPDRTPCNTALTQYSEVNGDTITTSSGLLYMDIAPGSGAAIQSGQFVRVHYSGYLTDRTRFGTSCVGQTPLGFTVGVGDVIEGFQEGIIGMRTGGVRRLIVPPELAYGDTASGSIPANSTLIFDVEVVSSLVN